ncbi:MAG: hypothetical protein N3A54_06850, partial [Patescibacteria group bacterium]|nr:hypothetical protein [Patescibacteria group bacterium]
FTDDDCILDGSWLSTIISTFDRYPGISGIYGCTKPYLPAFKEGCICPCVTKNLRNQKGGVIKNFSKHWEDLGFGNNMAFRREVFEELGDFKEWLGPGSIGMNCEDGEIALRCLVSKKNLYYNPKMIVYHNRWLTKEEYQRQELSYICGEMACYGYYAFQGYSFGRDVVKENIVKTLKDFKAAIKSLLFLNKGIFHSWKWFFLGLYARLRGIFVGFIFFLREKYIHRILK